MILLFSSLCYKKENPERVKTFLSIFRGKISNTLLFFFENYVQSEYASKKRAKGAEGTKRPGFFYISSVADSG